MSRPQDSRPRSGNVSVRRSQLRRSRLRVRSDDPLLLRRRLRSVNSSTIRLPLRLSSPSQDDETQLHPNRPRPSQSFDRRTAARCPSFNGSSSSFRAPQSSSLASYSATRTRTARASRTTALRVRVSRTPLHLRQRARGTPGASSPRTAAALCLRRRANRADRERPCRQIRPRSPKTEPTSNHLWPRTSIRSLLD